MDDFVTYESASQNLRWEKSKSTGELRNQRDIYTLSELNSQLDKARTNVSKIERAIEYTDARNAE